MPQIQAVETDTLTLPDSGAEVVIKRRATFGDQRRAQAAMLKIDTASGAISAAEWSAYISVLVSSLIVRWDLTDESGQALPVTVDNLDRLSAEDGQFLSVEATKRTSLRGDAQERPFEKQSSEPSPVTT